MLALAIVLIVLWVLGGFVFKVAGALIHLLLLVAVVALVMHFIRGRKPTA
ncbi:MAG TPA: lmo0937 family membrane protein [Gemmatimonadaceae bacterium]|nr:lmo0937 family membrane protein [Gemmatimonadaceae bacterium]